MRRRRTALTASVLVLAVTCLPLLPKEHIHVAGIEGRNKQIVHVHPVDAAAGGSDVSVLQFHGDQFHGDHGLAIFLTTVYDSVSRFAQAPTVLVATAAVIAPVLQTLGVVQACTVQSAHGPPRSVWLTRGPPSLS